MLTGPFASVLAERRARFNGLFAEARLARPTLDGDAFKDVLARLVAPLVERVAAVDPAQAGPVADALYVLALDLTGRDLLGPRARHPAVLQGWTWLLPELAPRLAEAPRRLPGAVTNALYHLALTPGARPDDWMLAVAELSPLCADVSELLAAGQVAAWRCGLAHFRLGALDVCARLAPPVAALALGLDAPPADLQLILRRLRADPWLDPRRAAAPADGEPYLRLVARAGAFRGFGGHFIAPPTVTCPGGLFVVGDGERLWTLTADRFGATFHRLEAMPGAGEPPPAPADPAAPGVRITRSGKISWGKASAVFPELESHLSHAASAHTLAVTTPLSHAVFLVALDRR
jgi:hypothetical protein